MKVNEENKSWLYRPIFHTETYLLTEEEAVDIYYKFFPKSVPIDNFVMQWALQTELQIRNYCQTKFGIPAKPFQVIDGSQDCKSGDECAAAKPVSRRVYSGFCGPASSYPCAHLQQDERLDHPGAPEPKANPEKRV